MEIPEGWPTGRMCVAFEKETETSITMEAFDRGLRAALAAAPTQPAQEDEPVLYQIRMVENGNKGRWIDSDKTQYNKLNGKGWEGRKLYTRPASDNLRKAAEETERYLTKLANGKGIEDGGYRVLTNLRAALRENYGNTSETQ